MKTRNVVFGVLLALVGMVSIIGATEFAGYPYITDIVSNSDSMFVYEDGYVTVNNPNSYNVVSDVRFEEIGGSDIIIYPNETLIPGENNFVVPMPSMGGIRVSVDYYSYPQYDSDGKAITGTSIGMPKTLIEPRIDYTNQIDAPMWFARTYLNTYHMNGAVNF
jgi:hypothetical protein